MVALITTVRCVTIMHVGSCEVWSWGGTIVWQSMLQECILVRIVNSGLEVLK